MISLLNIYIIYIINIIPREDGAAESVPSSVSYFLSGPLSRGPVALVVNTRLSYFHLQLFVVCFVCPTDVLVFDSLDLFRLCGLTFSVFRRFLHPRWLCMN